jgi:ABC-type transporter Mla subunit MlaD
METTVDLVVEYVKENYKDISVIITLILTVFYQVRKHRVLNKSIGTLNNNAVTVAENSKDAIKKALEEMGGVSSVVTNYKTEIEALLAAFRVSEEDKKKLEQTLTEVHTALKTAKLANVELANEVAELLVLANIPNSKKEELYSRHLAAVGAIADAEKTEVILDDNGQEAE